jgi:hypothetical protein
VRKSGFKEGCAGGEVRELDEERTEGGEDCEVVWEDFEDGEEGGAGLGMDEMGLV